MSCGSLLDGRPRRRSRPRRSDSACGSRRGWVTGGRSRSYSRQAALESSVVRHASPNGLEPEWPAILESAPLQRISEVDAPGPCRRWRARAADVAAVPVPTTREPVETGRLRSWGSLARAGAMRLSDTSRRSRRCARSPCPGLRRPCASVEARPRHGAFALSLGQAPGSRIRIRTPSDLPPSGRRAASHRPRTHREAATNRPPCGHGPAARRRPSPT